MILAKSKYKTYNSKLLAIIKAFKNYKYENFILINYNNI